MRKLNESEVNSASGADIGYSDLVGMWNDAGLNSQGYFNYDRAAKSINALGFASATENKDWNTSSIGEAGWILNGAGEKVTWFNNGVFMAFRIG
ncbi:hypothetical protein [Pantoea agglomerans]|uniref:hypothetical protein n=1 Tax=Enterobacter agglomerans TaxID=549 RepID=UPI0013C8F956|nr:hypothetical protein [Pantoea agglomerans]NEG60707.1 hypothetical protein [Pantoea agglomerans]NEH05080.1 hypothetical protein [Pantoea agglomerans]